MLSERVRGILPPDTALTWEAITPIVPSTAYLGGGTAIAVHLGHRVSRDLVFFFHRNSVNLEELITRLSEVGPFAVTERAPGTLNGIFSARVQFLHADETRPQRLLESPTQVDGLHIAQISDLMAMKLEVVGDRGELRDYFDLMTIEQRRGRTVDEGLALFLERFQPEYPDQAINHILLGLGYFDDVDPDEALSVHASRSLTTGRADSVKSSPPAAANRMDHASVLCPHQSPLDGRMAPLRRYDSVERFGRSRSAQRPLVQRSPARKQPNVTLWLLPKGSGTSHTL
jgi:hypothetical protein